MFDHEETAVEDRYVIQAFDPHTWSILDTSTSQAYMLCLNMLGNLMVQISLAEVSMSQMSGRYVTYLREIMVCNVQVSDVGVAYETMDYIMIELQGGIDVANPVEIAVRLGADLHGQPVEWENERAH